MDGSSGPRSPISFSRAGQDHAAEAGDHIIVGHQELAEGASPLLRPPRKDVLPYLAKTAEGLVEWIRPVANEFREGGRDLCRSIPVDALWAKGTQDGPEGGDDA